MKHMVATEAKTRFGQLIDEAQNEPVVIQKNGRDVAVVLSAEEFKRMTQVSLVNPEVKRSLERSIGRWDKVYQELAK